MIYMHNDSLPRPLPPPPPPPPQRRFAGCPVCGRALLSFTTDRTSAICVPCNIIMPMEWGQ
jgi:hypothetical protein